MNMQLPEKGTLKYYRLQLGMSEFRFAGMCDVSRATIRAAEAGKPIQEVNAYKIIKALEEKLPADENFDVREFQTQISIAK